MSELSSVDIFRILEDCAITRKHFVNVFAHDQLPSYNIRKRKWIIVCNASPSSSRGTHWFLLFKENDTIELIDSLGANPTTYNLVPFLKSQNTDQCVYNSMRLQSLQSKVCGHYCLFFAFWRCMGYTLEDILQIFNEVDLNDNDSLVLRFYEKKIY